MLSRYDQWVTREPPWADVPDPWELQGHCSVCGCWLRREPDLSIERIDNCECSGPDPEYGTRECETMGSMDYGHCTGPHKFQAYGGILNLFSCRYCGTTNQMEEW